MKKSPVGILAGVLLLIFTGLSAYNTWQAGVLSNLLPVFMPEIWPSYLLLALPVLGYALVTASLFAGLPWLASLGGLLAAVPSGINLFYVILPHFAVIATPWLFLAKTVLLLLSLGLLILCGLLPGRARPLAAASVLCMLAQYAVAIVQTGPARITPADVCWHLLFTAGVLLLGAAFRAFSLRRRASRAGWDL